MPNPSLLNTKLPDHWISQSTTTTTKSGNENHEHAHLLPHCPVLHPPLLAILSLLSYVLWYTLNSNSGVQFVVSWQGKPHVTWELQNTTPDWKDMQKQSDCSLDNSGW